MPNGDVVFALGGPCAVPREWPEQMRIAGIVALTAWVLFLLAATVPRVFLGQSNGRGISRSVDTETARELSDHQARLRSIEQQDQVVERMRIGERMAALEVEVISLKESVRWNTNILTAVLLGIALQLFKDLTSYLRTKSASGRRNG